VIVQVFQSLLRVKRACQPSSSLSKTGDEAPVAGGDYQCIVKWSGVISVLHGAHRIVALELALLPRYGSMGHERPGGSAGDPLFGHLPGMTFRADVVGETCPSMSCHRPRTVSEMRGELLAPLLQDDLVRSRADDRLP